MNKKIALFGCLGLIGIVVIIAIICGSWGISTHNEMVAEQESATTAWANVQSTYQRRNDLIKNLEEVVMGAGDLELAEVKAMMEARSRAGSVMLDPTKMTAEQMQEYQRLQGDVTTALSRLMVVNERYPELKANERYGEMIVELEGTENRINEARNHYNAAVQKYNTLIRRFPASLIAGLAGFDKMIKFEAEAGAEKAPELNMRRQ